MTATASGSWTRHFREETCRGKPSRRSTASLLSAIALPERSPTSPGTTFPPYAGKLFPLRNLEPPPKRSSKGRRPSSLPNIRPAGVRAAPVPRRSFSSAMISRGLHSSLRKIPRLGSSNSRLPTFLLATREDSSKPRPLLRRSRPASARPRGDSLKVLKEGGAPRPLTGSGWSVLTGRPQDAFTTSRPQDF